MGKLDRTKIEVVAGTIRIIRTETDLLNQVIELAGLTGWLIHHDRPAMRADGTYRTAIQGHKGFPDLVLAKGGRTIFRELKNETDEPDEYQKAWLQATGGKLWRPSDWPEIVKTLTGRNK